jgi:Bcr/CflA subfamily drug resistance transporter
MKKPRPLSYILLLAPLSAIPAMSMDMYVPAIPKMMTLLNEKQASVQVTLSLFVFGISIGQLFIGPISDRYGRRPTILYGLLAFIFSSFLCAISTHIYALIVFRFLQALGACACFLTSRAVIRDTFEEEDQAASFSYLSAATGLAPLLAPILGGFLLYWTNNWRSTFFFLVLYGLVLYYIVFFTLKESLHPNQKQAIDRKFIKRYFQLFKDHYFLVYSFCASIAMSGLFLFFSVSPIIIISLLDKPAHHFGYYFGINAGVFFIFNMLCPHLKCHIGSRNTLIIASLMMIFGASLMIFLDLLLGLSLWGMLIPNLFICSGSALTMGPALSKALEQYGKIAGTASAVYGCIQFMIPSLIGGIVMIYEVKNTGSLSYPMLTLGCLMLISLLSTYKKTSAFLTMTKE